MQARSRPARGAAAAADRRAAGGNDGNLPPTARLKVHRVPVWVLLGYWQGSAHDAGAVAEAYEVPVEAIAAALAYYRRHWALIDARIALNAAAFTA